MTWAAEMPDLRAAVLDGGPTRHPLRYPGTPVPGSCLIAGAWLYPLEAPAHSAGDRRDRGDGHGDASTGKAAIGGWRLHHDGGPVPAPATTLDAALAALGATAMAGRRPVVAVGSNAAPSQLLHKYRAGLERVAIPVTRAAVHGLAVGYSAHISLPGYVPYVPVRNGTPHAVTTLHVLWLDDEQLRRMDETEPNYVRVEVAAEVATAAIGPGRTLGSFHVYRGRWGALRAAAGGPTLAAVCQEHAYSALAGHGWFRALVPELARDGAAAAAAALALDPQRRDSVRTELAARRLACADLLDAPGVRASVPALADNS